MNNTQSLARRWLGTPTNNRGPWVAAVICIVGLFSTLSDLALSREQHEAHTHGDASLNLVADNSMLELQFESPAINLVGFEHAPINEEQRSAIERMRSILDSPNKVILIEGANCSPVSASVEIEGPAGDTKEHNQHNDENHGDELSDEDHSHTNDTKEHDQHSDENHGDELSDEDHSHTNDTKESHSEIVAMYAFNCEGGANLKSVSVKLFERFKGLQKISVNWVTESAQGAAVLKADSTRIKLR